MDRRFTPPKRETSPTWGPPPPCKQALNIYIYYIHTEKYSLKSYVVNFRTQISSSQSEERTMVFTREKNDTSNQKPQRCVSFAPKFPPFIAACSAASHTFNEKSFTQRVFLAKKVKNISEMEWNSFVCFTVDKENGREPPKEQRKGKNRTRRKLLLCFLSELLCLSFKLKLILKPSILLKFTHFQLCIEKKQLRLLIVLGYLISLPSFTFLTNVFTKLLILRFRCHFAVSM